MQLNVENHLAKTTTSFSTINFTLDEGLKSTANMRKPSVNNLLWLNTKISTQALSFGNSAYVEKKAFCMTKSTWGNGLWPSRSVLSAQCENTRGPLWGDIYHGFQVCEESSRAVFHISLLRTLAIIKSLPGFMAEVISPLPPDRSSYRVSVTTVSSEKTVVWLPTEAAVKRKG